MGPEILIPVLLGAANTGTSVMAAQEQNRNARRARDANIEANRIEARNKNLEIAHNLNSFLGASRSTGAARGVVGGNTPTALAGSAAYQAETTGANVELYRLVADQSAVANYQRSYVSPALAGLQGVIGGVTSGIQLSTGILSLQNLQGTADATRPNNRWEIM